MRNNPIRHHSHNHGPGQVNDIRENSTFNHTFSLDACKVFKNRDLIIRDIMNEIPYNNNNLMVFNFH